VIASGQDSKASGPLVGVEATESSTREGTRHFRDLAKLSFVGILTVWPLHGVSKQDDVVGAGNTLLWISA
jgi:hypothetical protein